MKAIDKTVSVIIPLYNSENFIDETLKSVIEQTHKSLQIILVDDGSTDNTKKKLESYIRLDKRIQYYRKTNGGPNDARLFGLKHANGQYIKFLDHDDLLHPQAIEILCRYALTEDNFIISSSLQLFEDKAPKFNQLLDTSITKNSLPSPLSLCQEIKSTFNEILFSANLFVMNEQMDAQLMACEELDLLGKIHLNHKQVTVIHLDGTPLLLKRCHEDSHASKMRKYSQSNLNWALKCRLKLLHLIQHKKSLLDHQMREVITDPIYVLAIYTYRNGLEVEALDSIQARKIYHKSVPTFSPTWHYHLHKLFGFHLTEIFLKIARRFLKSKPTSHDA